MKGSNILETCGERKGEKGGRRERGREGERGRQEGGREREGGRGRQEGGREREAGRREREGGRKEGGRGRQEGGREREAGRREREDTSKTISQDFSADESATLTFDPTPHLAAPWAVQCGLELSLEHAHHHTLVPLQVLVPGLLRHVLGGREGGGEGGRREGGEEEGGGREGKGRTGKGEGGEGRGRERVRGRGGAATEACKPCMYVCMYMYMRKGLGIFLENCEKPAATWD